jgi:UDP-glucose 4-epimerase
VDFVQASLNDEAAVKQALEDVELVFHEAAIPSVPRSVEIARDMRRASMRPFRCCWRRAGKGTARRLCRIEFGLRSADASRNRGVPIRFRPVPLPNSSANIAAKSFTGYGLETVALRYFNVFGPRQDPSQYSGVISRFISVLMSGETPVIFGDGEQTRFYFCPKCRRC